MPVRRRINAATDSGGAGVAAGSTARSWRHRASLAWRGRLASSPKSDAHEAVGDNVEQEAADDLWRLRTGPGSRAPGRGRRRAVWRRRPRAGGGTRRARRSASPGPRWIQQSGAGRPQTRARGGPGACRGGPGRARELEEEAGRAGIQRERSQARALASMSGGFAWRGSSVVVPVWQQTLVRAPRGIDFDAGCSRRNLGVPGGRRGSSQAVIVPWSDGRRRSCARATAYDGHARVMRT
jgi:hypothetical protein